VSQSWHRFAVLSLKRNFLFSEASCEEVSAVYGQDCVVEIYGDLSLINKTRFVYFDNVYSINGKKCT